MISALNTSSYNVPDNVQNPKMKYYNDFFYVIGGYAANSRTGGFYRYSLSNNTWENITSPSYSRIPKEAPILIYNHFLYVILGTYGTSTTLSNSIFKVNLENEDWIWEEIFMDPSNSRMQFSVAGSQNNFYLFGGADTQNYNDLRMISFNNSSISFNNSSISLSVVAPNYLYPSARSNHCLILILRYLYLFGGLGSQGYLSDLWRFDTETNLWESILQQGDIPSPRHLFSYDSFGNGFFVWGGEDFSGLRNDLYLFNTLTTYWTLITPSTLLAPTIRKGACGVFQMPYIYIFGGQTVMGTSGELWKFDLGNSQYSLVSTYFGIVFAECELIDNNFYIYFGEKYNGEVINGINTFNFSLNQWLPFQNISNAGGAIQGIAVTIADYFVYYGGRNSYFTTHNTIRVKSPLKNASVTTNLYVYNSAFGVYKTNLYISSGGSLNLYSVMAPLLYNPIFAYIDLNLTFSEFGIFFECSPGTMYSNGVCEPCPEGTYSETFSNTECVPCGPGTYNDLTGANSLRQCIPCPYGSYNNRSKANKCLQCKGSDYCPIGSKLPSLWSDFSPYQSVQPKNLRLHQYDSTITLVEMYYGIAMLIVIGLILLFGCQYKFIQLDQYTNSHNYEENVPLIKKKTLFGGFFTFIFYMCAVMLLIIGILQYSLENLNESKSLQPLVVLQEQVENFYADIVITVALVQYFDQCGDNNVCTAKIRIQPIGIQNAKKSFVTCYKDLDDNCWITYTFLHCYLDSDANILYELSEEYSFASGIFVSVNSNSSIPESNSIIQSGIFAEDQKVFLGSTPTYFYFSMTPSFFESDYKNYPSSATGYHTGLSYNPAYGSQNSVENLITSNGLRISVQLTLTTTGLYTSRFRIQSLFILASALLGSISGAMNAVGFFMGYVEQKYVRRKTIKDQKKFVKNLTEMSDAIRDSIKIDEETSDLHSLGEDSLMNNQKLTKYTIVKI